jgi:hypothetical protein
METISPSPQNKTTKRLPHHSEQDILYIPVKTFRTRVNDRMRTERTYIAGAVMHQVMSDTISFTLEAFPFFAFGAGFHRAAVQSARGVDSGV